MPRIVIRDLDDPMSYHMPVGSYVGVVTLVMPLPDHPFLSAYHGNSIQAEIKFDSPRDAEQVRAYIYERREFLRDLISELVQVHPQLKDSYRRLMLESSRLTRAEYAETNQSPDLIEDLWSIEQDPWDDELK